MMVLKNSVPDETDYLNEEMAAGKCENFAQNANNCVTKQKFFYQLQNKVISMQPKQIFGLTYQHQFNVVCTIHY